MSKNLLFAGAALSLYMVATAAVAAPPPGTLISGWDGSNVRQILVDNTGKLQVVGAAAGGIAFGPDLAGVAATQAPVRVAGCSSVTGATCTVRNILVDANGSASVSGFSTTGVSLSSVAGLMIGGSDGTNYRHLAVNSNGQLQIVGSAVSGSALGTINGTMIGGNDGTNFRNLSVDATGKLNVNNISGTISLPTGAATDTTVAASTVAQGAAIAGKVGPMLQAEALTTPTAVTTATVNPLTTDPVNGALRVEILPIGVAASTQSGATASVDGESNTRQYFVVEGRGALLNGSSLWDRARSVQGNDNTGLGMTGVAIAPNSSVGSAITPVVSTTAESNHVLKAGAGNMYRTRVTTGATAGFLMIFNATSAPVDGAVTPLSCTIAPANSTVEVDHSQVPDRYGTGITAVFSTTGCFTKTASATAMFEGFVQ